MSYRWWVLNHPAPVCRVIAATPAEVEAMGFTEILAGWIAELTAPGSTGFSITREVR